MSINDNQVTSTYKWLVLMSPSLSVLDQLDSPRSSKLSLVHFHP